MSKIYHSSYWNAPFYQIPVPLSITGVWKSKVYLKRESTNTLTKLTVQHYHPTKQMES